MSDNFTQFGKMFSTFLSYYVITRVTKRSADVVRMAYTLYFIKAFSGAAGETCGKL